MSIIRCDRCSTMIDSDEDAECFVEPDKFGKLPHVWCEPCRDADAAYWDRVDEGRQRAKDGESPTHGG